MHGQPWCPCGSAPTLPLFTSPLKPRDASKHTERVGKWRCVSLPQSQGWLKKQKALNRNCRVANDNRAVRRVREYKGGRGMCRCGSWWLGNPGAVWLLGGALCRPPQPRDNDGRGPAASTSHLTHTGGERSQAAVPQLHSMEVAVDVSRGDVFNHGNGEGEANFQGSSKEPKKNNLPLSLSLLGISISKSAVLPPEFYYTGRNRM